jgi:hypothetical protein
MGFLISNDLPHLEFTHGIKLFYSLSYFLHGNQLDESTNKNLIKILKEIVKDNQRDWYAKPNFSLWVDQVTPRIDIEQSPCTLWYGTLTILPIYLQILALNPLDGVMGNIVGCHLLYPRYPWPHESLPLRKSPQSPQVPMYREKEIKNNLNG